MVLVGFAVGCALAGLVGSWVGGVVLADLGLVSLYFEFGPSSMC